MQKVQYHCRRNIYDVTNLAIATRFSTEVVFWQVQTCAKFHCPSLTVTLFPGGGGIHPPVIKTPKKPGLNRVKQKHLYQLTIIKTQKKNIRSTSDSLSLALIKILNPICKRFQ